MEWWDGLKWGGMDVMEWDRIGWDGMVRVGIDIIRWDGMRWDGYNWLR